MKIVVSIEFRRMNVTAFFFLMFSLFRFFETTAKAFSGSSRSPFPCLQFILLFDSIIGNSQICYAHYQEIISIFLTVRWPQCDIVRLASKMNEKTLKYCSIWLRNGPLMVIMSSACLTTWKRIYFFFWVKCNCLFGFTMSRTHFPINRTETFDKLYFYI